MFLRTLRLLLQNNKTAGATRRPVGDDRELLYGSYVARNLYREFYKRKFPYSELNPDWDSDFSEFFLEGFLLGERNAMDHLRRSSSIQDASTSV